MKRVGWKTLLLPGALTAFFGAIAGLLAGHGEDCHPAWTFLAGALLSGCAMLGCYLAGVRRPATLLSDAAQRILAGTSPRGEGRPAFQPTGAGAADRRV